MIVIGRGAPQNSDFRISRRFGVWSVTRDDIFYGDYLSRGAAVDAACEAARAVEILGGAARVQVTPSGEVIRHHDLAQAAGPKVADRGRRSAR